MKFVLVLLACALSVILTGCVSYSGGSFTGDLHPDGTAVGSGTSEVSTGDMPGFGVTGSQDVPRGFYR